MLVCNPIPAPICNTCLALNLMGNMKLHSTSHSDIMIHLRTGHIITGFHISMIINVHKVEQAFMEMDILRFPPLILRFNIILWPASINRKSALLYRIRPMMNCKAIIVPSRCKVSEKMDCKALSVQTWSKMDLHQFSMIAKTGNLFKSRKGQSAPLQVCA
ncbi:hypothetical protein L7F22_035818 [Adiantum nelumboides]|nr:hypothetical protein [Adiantum nelumboides]